MISAALGWGVLIGGAAWAARAVGRRAAAEGILVPLLVGVGVRIAVMAIAHLASLSLGDHGIFFLDDETYRQRASVLAGFWADGQLPNPARFDVVGSYQFGYELFLALVYSLGTPSVLLGKLVNVLLGGATVFVVARIAGQVLGERAKVRAAWIAALAPGMVWWSATMMKESLATLLLALGILAVINLPRGRAAIALGGVVALLFLVRGPGALALLAGAAVAVAIAGRSAEGRWRSRALVTFTAGAACAVGAIVLVVSRGDLPGLFSRYEQVLSTMVQLYQGGNPIRIPYDVAKSLVTPLPWVIDRGTENWDRMLYPGVWLLFCALPLAAIGAWRLRRRPEAWLLLVTIGTALTINSLTSGFVFRQRSMLEPLIFVLALAGVSSWRMAARCAAAVLAVVAVVAGVQSRSPLVAACVVAAAASLYLLSRFLPSARVEPPPGSPMVARYRAAMQAAPGVSDGAAGPIRVELERLGNNLAAWAGSAHAALLRVAPTLEREPPGAPRPPGLAARVLAAVNSPAPPAGGVPAVRLFRRRRGPGTQIGAAEGVPSARAPQPAVPQPSERVEASAAGTYRPALDGIRAVAVLAVIVYHLRSGTGGGFLGVDIFFVLSGYLITTLLLREYARTGRIDLANFWARRARRLLPALLIVVAAVALVVAGGSASTFGARREDLISTVFYFANWHFIEAGQSYFAQFSGTSPLEHMWSLAIEEQFYLLWPLLVMGLLLVFRHRLRALLAFAVAGTAASAALMAATLDPTDPTRSYFGTDTRAHALLAGAALSILLQINPSLRDGERARRIAVRALPVAVALVGVALFVTSDGAELYYRGGSLAFAFLVALTLLWVEAAPQSIPGRLLSLRPMRWVGMISYGLYLWHFPIIQWVGDWDLVSDARMKQVVAVFLTFLAATLSFYLVERRIRSGRALFVGTSPKRSAIAMGVAAAAVIGLAVQSTSLRDPIERQVNDVGGMDCPQGSPAPVPSFAWCVRVEPAKAGAPSVAVVGDSTALALDKGMRSEARRRGWGYVQAGRLGCSVLPLLFPNHPDRPADVADARRCVRGVNAVLTDVATTERPRVWLVSDRWSLFPLHDRGGRTLQPGDPRRERLVEDAWRKRLRALSAGGADVVVVLTPPRAPPVECATESPPPEECASPVYTTSDPPTALARAAVQRAAEGLDRVTLVSVDDLLCPDRGRCPAVVDGVLTRYDGIHFTGAFSVRVLKAVFARAERAGVPLGPAERRPAGRG